MIKLKQLLESSARGRLKKRADTYSKSQNSRASRNYIADISKRFKHLLNILELEFQEVRHAARSGSSTFGEVLATVLAQDVYAHAEVVGKVHPSLDRELKQLRKECLKHDQDPVEFFALAAEAFELYGGLKFHS